MKKYCKLLLIMLMAFCLTGCVRYKNDITIRDDGRADVAFTIALVEDYWVIVEAHSVDMDDVCTRLERKEWTVTPYSEDEYTGYTFSKEDVDLEEAAEDLNGINLSDLTSYGFDMGGFELYKNEQEKTYTIDWEVFQAQSEIAELNSYFVQEYDGFLKISMTFPEVPIEHNATKTSEDGKTLEWNLTKLNGDESVYVKYKLPEAAVSSNGFSWSFHISGIVLIIVLLILAGLIALIIIIASSNKKKKMAYGYGQPYNPQMQQGYNPYMQPNPYMQQQFQPQMPVQANPYMQPQMPQQPQQFVQPQQPVQPQTTQQPVVTDNSKWAPGQDFNPEMQQWDDTTV
jgi:hypothetical protein